MATQYITHKKGCARMRAQSSISRFVLRQPRVSNPETKVFSLFPTLARSESNNFSAAGVACWIYISWVPMLLHPHVDAMCQKAIVCPSFFLHTRVGSMFYGFSFGLSILKRFHIGGKKTLRQCPRLVTKKLRDSRVWRDMREKTWDWQFFDLLLFWMLEAWCIYRSRIERVFQVRGSRGFVDLLRCHM